MAQLLLFDDDDNNKGKEGANGNADGEDDPSSSGAKAESSTAVASPSVEEVAIIQWQEKVFSPQEFLHYKGLKGVSTALDNMYVDEVKGIIREHEHDTNENEEYLPKQVLVTKVDKDNFVDPSRFLENVTTAEWELVSQLSLAVYDPVNCKLRCKEKVKGRQGKEMYLCAAIGEYKQATTGKVTSWEGKELVLCRIAAMPDGSFTMRPGLSSDEDEKRPYRLVAENGDVYEYTIEIANARDETTNAEYLREEAIHQMQERQLALRHNLIPSDFTALPPPHVCRVHVHGEIVWCRGYGRSHIYAKYALRMPRGWEITNPERCIPQGTSHRTTSMYHPTKGNLFMLCYPFEFHLSQHEQRSGVLPTIDFTVSSCDWLNRHRVEGYGYVPISSQPGYFEKTLRLWHPVGSLTSRLKSHLFGGSSELRNSGYASIPSDFHSTFLNKYGFETEAGGELFLRYSVCQQRQEVQGAPSTPGRRHTSHFIHRAFASPQSAISKRFRRSRLRTSEDTHKKAE